LLVGPHPHSLRLDSLRSLAAAAGASYFARGARLFSWRWGPTPSAGRVARSRSAALSLAAARLAPSARACIR